VHNLIHSEASPKPGGRRRVGHMGEDTTAIKKPERNPMNMTTVGKHRFRKCLLKPMGFLPIQ